MLGRIFWYRYSYHGQTPATPLREPHISRIFGLCDYCWRKILWLLLEEDNVIVAGGRYCDYCWRKMWLLLEEDILIIAGGRHCDYCWRKIISARFDAVPLILNKNLFLFRLCRFYNLWFLKSFAMGQKIRRAQVRGTLQRRDVCVWLVNVKFGGSRLRFVIVLYVLVNSLGRNVDHW